MKLKITRSEMIRRATESARRTEREQLKRLAKTGDSVIHTLEIVDPDALESDRDIFSDLVSAHESENY